MSKKSAAKNTPLPDTLEELEQNVKAMEATEAANAPYKIYVAYNWRVFKGNRSGTEACFVNVAFPDITTQEHIEAIIAWLVNNHAYDDVTLIFWRSLEA